MGLTDYIQGIQQRATQNSPEGILAEGASKDVPLKDRWLDQNVLLPLAGASYRTGTRLLGGAVQEGAQSYYDSNTKLWPERFLQHDMLIPLAGASYRTNRRIPTGVAQEGSLPGDPSQQIRVITPALPVLPEQRIVPQEVWDRQNTPVVSGGPTRIPFVDNEPTYGKKNGTYYSYQQDFNPPPESPSLSSMVMKYQMEKPLPPTIYKVPDAPQAQFIPTGNPKIQPFYSKTAELLADAIGFNETGGKKDAAAYKAKGGSGENGRHQYMPGTWKNYSEQYAKAILGGVPKGGIPQTPENQELVTKFKMQQFLNMGYTPQQIAATWNSGKPNGWEGKRGYNDKGQYYDVPAYVNKFLGNYKKVQELDRLKQEEEAKLAEQRRLQSVRTYPIQDSTVAPMPIQLRPQGEAMRPIIVGQ